MISKKAYEIAEVISKQRGFSVDMTSEQVLNWYGHLCNDSNKQGYFRVTLTERAEILRLNGLGFGHEHIKSMTGHTRQTISHILYEAQDDTLDKRVKKAQELIECL